MSAIIPYIPMIAQTASSLINSNSQAKGQTDQASYSADRFDTNAKLADQQANDAITRGELDASAHDRKVKLLIGQQRAKMGAQGADLSSGSALDIQKDTAGLGAEDILQIKNNAYREAWGYRVQADDYRRQADLQRSSGKNSSRNTILTGLSEAVGTGFQAYTASKANTKVK